ncbi:MAG TPA: hypothetical protein ENK18_23100 [Deltaproteobacteria bacterium]|nr:hypothetical protein [Deltaproteobacteria bacterium]
MYLAAMALFPAYASAPETLSLGELYGHQGGWMGNAFTTPKGMASIHPFLRSSVGVTDQIDLKASLPRLLGGPQLFVELAPIQSESLAASLELHYQAPWSLVRHTLGATGHASLMLGTVVLNASLTGRTEVGRRAVATLPVTEPTISTPPGEGTLLPDPPDAQLEDPGTDVLRPEVGLTFRLSDPTALVLTARTNLLGWGRNGPQGALGAYVAHGSDALGLSAGLNLAVLGLAGLQRELNSVEDVGLQPLQLPAAVPIPLPHAQIWFRL